MNTFTSSLYARPWFRAIKPAGLDADGEVGGSDLAILLGLWGTGAIPQQCDADLVSGGFVNGADIAFLLGN